VKVFSRPGPWLVQSLEALVEALHDEAQQFGHRGRLWQVLSA
jgi:iron complex transport system substrate-binding protein